MCLWCAIPFVDAVTARDQKTNDENPHELVFLLCIMHIQSNFVNHSYQLENSKKALRITLTTT